LAKPVLNENFAGILGTRIGIKIINLPVQREITRNRHYPPQIFCQRRLNKKKTLQKALKNRAISFFVLSTESQDNSTFFPTFIAPMIK
jgi:hypothetical protein